MRCVSRRALTRAVRAAQPHARDLDDALSGLRYLKALAAIGAKHKLAGADTHPFEVDLT